MATEPLPKYICECSSSLYVPGFNWRGKPGPVEVGINFHYLRAYLNGNPHPGYRLVCVRKDGPAYMTSGSGYELFWELI